jgi:heme/copper-type cytochrome/quinol oxidase subunit 2
LVAGLGALAILVAARAIFAALSGAPRERADEASMKPVIGTAIVVILGLAAAGGFGVSEASTPDQSAAGTPASYQAVPLTDPQLKVGHNIKPPAGPAMSVQINGQQYLWRYTYVGANSGYSYQELVIPVGVTVMLDVTSSDVVHSWWVPQLGGAIEAVPGYVNKGWIRADKAGTYSGASTTPSGSNYQNMTTTVVALPLNEFETWITNKSAEIGNALTQLGADRTSGKEQQLITGGTGATGAAKGSSK